MSRSFVTVGILGLCSLFRTLLWMEGTPVAVEDWVKKVLFDLLER